MSAEIAVLISFIAFIAIVVFVNAPAAIAKALDGRADHIRRQLDEARAAREEAQSLFAEFERKQEEAKAEAQNIVARAKEEAAQSLEAAKKDLAASIERRMKTAEDRISQAEASAKREIVETASAVAISAAQTIIASDLKAGDADALIDDGVASVASRLN